MQEDGSSGVNTNLKCCISLGYMHDLSDQHDIAIRDIHSVQSYLLTNVYNDVLLARPGWGMLELEGEVKGCGSRQPVDLAPLKGQRQVKG